MAHVVCWWSRKDQRTICGQATWRTDVAGSRVISASTNWKYPLLGAEQWMWFSQTLAWTYYWGHRARLNSRRILVEQWQWQIEAPGRILPEAQREGTITENHWQRCWQQRNGWRTGFHTVMASSAPNFRATAEATRGLLSCPRVSRGNAEIGISAHELCGSWERISNGQYSRRETNHMRSRAQQYRSPYYNWTIMENQTINFSTWRWRVSIC